MRSCVSSEPAAPARRALVLDANILIRAVLGRRVLSLLEAYADRVDFLAPEIAFIDASVYLPEILVSRGISPEIATRLLGVEALARLPMLVTPTPHEVYADLEPEARRRLQGRDEADWPIAALALRLGCPIWTEDRDFFGIGIATWTSDRVEIYLTSPPLP